MVKNKQVLRGASLLKQAETMPFRLEDFVGTIAADEYLEILYP